MSQLHQASTPPRGGRRATVLLIIVGVLTVLIVPLNLYVVLSDRRQELAEGGSQERRAETPLKRSFEGSADQLKQTLVIPALKSPLKADHNAAWCGTMNLAWRKFQERVTQQPLRLQDAEQLCDWLNLEQPVELEPEHYYVAAGLYDDGILERIQKELPARFPEAPVPTLPPLPPDAIAHHGLAYAYLHLVFKYQFDFKENDEPLEFVDAANRKTKVKSFGIRLKDKGTSGYRDQVKVLFRQGNEFAVDLSFLSRPYQVVVARIPLKDTLAATLEDLDRRIQAGPSGSLNDSSVLLVPTMCWRIDRHFTELEKKMFLMPGFKAYRMEDVEQMIDFKMDRSGVVLASRMKMRSVLLNGDDDHSDPNYFVFDRPYLVVLKKRDGRAFFAVWAANAELLMPY
jgi:hypothetical protein